MGDNMKSARRDLIEQIEQSFRDSNRHINVSYEDQTGQQQPVAEREELTPSNPKGSQRGDAQDLSKHSEAHRP